MKSRSLLITGSTGIMGSWVLAEALAHGYDPVVLMRDADEKQARRRLAAVLSLVGRESDTDKLRILRGDTSRPDMGLNAAHVAELRAGLAGMIHCAACTSFSPERDEEIWATNVGGVTNVLRFLSGSKIPLFHVSSAYVAGDRRERVFETELDVNQGFNNTYEQSKCHSEGMVQRAMAEGSVRGAIFRPSIIVGATDDGRISQFQNFYNFLRFLDIASARGLNGNRRLRLMGNPQATKNLVPVDWTAKALWHILETEGPSGKTYHLTNPNPVKQHRILEWANEVLGVKRMEMTFVDQLDDTASRLEGAFNAALCNYRPYLGDEAHFDRTNTDRALGDALPFPEVGAGLYKTLLEFARVQKWRGLFGCRPEVVVEAGETVEPAQGDPKMADTKQSESITIRLDSSDLDDLMAEPLPAVQVG